jgi:hypothetical protein
MFSEIHFFVVGEDPITVTVAFEKSGLQEIAIS